jgi:hypothetical protein
VVITKYKRVVSKVIDRIISILSKYGCSREDAKTIALYLLLKRERCRFERSLKRPA